MDREELDRQLKEQGKNIELQTDKFSSGRKNWRPRQWFFDYRFHGGCFFGDIIPGNKQGNKAESSYSFPQTEQKKWRSCRQSEIRLLYRRSKRLVRLLLGSRRGFMIRIFLTAVWRWGRVSAPVLFFDKNGYIVTNNHVVSGSKEVNVSLSNGQTVPGKVVGTDASTDLAVVKIDGSDSLPVAVLGDSDALQIGETAIAIGNPLGLEFQGTVTVGVISALNRSLDDIDQRFKLIQTDAAINPGNSGGALVTADGKVVGINSAKISKEGIEGMGFAIPINQAKGVIEQLIANGKVVRAYLGVYAADKDIAARYGYQWDHESGILVMKVAKNSPLSLTDVRVGDYILSIDGKTVNTVKEMREIIDAHKPGDKISLVYEHNGRSETTEILLSSVSESDQ